MTQQAEYCSVETLETLTRFFARRVRNWQTAEDLTQEAAMRMHKAWSRFDGEAFRPWMFRIARNLLVDRARRNKDRGLNFTDLESGDEDASCRILATCESTASYAAETAEAARAVLDIEMPAAQRVVLELYSEGKSLPEISRLMECELPTTKGRLRLARAKVREALNA